MALPVFVYGTLSDFDLRQAVLGHADPGPVVQARLSGYCVVTVPDRTYPGLRPSPGESTVGFLLHGLSDADRLELDAYEGSEYYLDEAMVDQDGAAILAAVYRTVAPLPATAPPWSLDDWQRLHKAKTLADLAWTDHDPVDR